MAASVSAGLRASIRPRLIRLFSRFPYRRVIFRQRGPRGLQALSNSAVALRIILIVMAFATVEDYLTDRIFVVASAIVACLVAIFSAFAVKPVGREVMGAIDQVLVSYPQELLEKLKEQTEQSKALHQFIDVKSNQIFEKMHEYLEGAIEDRYKGSELQKLMGDLKNVELRMEQAKMDVVVGEIPRELRETIDRITLKAELIDAIRRFLSFMPMPRVFREALITIALFWIKHNLPRNKISQSNQNQPRWRYSGCRAHPPRGRHGPCISCGCDCGSGSSSGWGE
jgi:hypothetical protein